MKKILIIDDSEFIIESTSTLLKFEGYNVITASNGEEGVELAIKELPDLILCDISMPVLDGFGTIEKIRKNSKLATTPFIFLTAFTEKSHMRAGMEKGSDDFIVKPYTRNELIAAIDAQWSKNNLIEKQVNEKVESVGKSVTYALPHEFRTALNEVIGSAKYLKTSANEVKPEEIIELSNDIVYSANRLLKITEDFLIYVKIESLFTNTQERKELRNQISNEPAAMLVDIANQIADKYERANDITFQNITEGINVEISTESLYKLVNELVDNAFKFSQPGSKVIINTFIEDDLFYITIQDFGRGMSKEQLSGIAALAQFERTIYEQQGMGLGLVISKKLLELHDAIFNIESNENEGTIVKFGLHYNKI